MSAAQAELKAGRYDDKARRRAQRRGRERGCWVYIPAEEILKAGYPIEDDPPWYRVWGSARGGLFVRLYRDA